MTPTIRPPGVAGSPRGGEGGRGITEHLTGSSLTQRGLEKTWALVMERYSILHGNREAVQLASEQSTFQDTVAPTHCLVLLRWRLAYLRLVLNWEIEFELCWQLIF